MGDRALSYAARDDHKKRATQFRKRQTGRVFLLRLALNSSPHKIRKSCRTKSARSKTSFVHRQREEEWEDVKEEVRVVSEGYELHILDFREVKWRARTLHKRALKLEARGTTLQDRGSKYANRARRLEGRVYDLQKRAHELKIAGTKLQDMARKLTARTGELKRRAQTLERQAKIEDTEPRTFLKLPTELRELVYHYAMDDFPSDLVLTRQPLPPGLTFFVKRLPPVAFMNRQSLLEAAQTYLRRTNIVLEQSHLSIPTLTSLLCRFPSDKGFASVRNLSLSTRILQYEGDPQQFFPGSIINQFHGLQSLTLKISAGKFHNKYERRMKRYEEVVSDLRLRSLLAHQGSFRLTLVCVSSFGRDPYMAAEKKIAQMFVESFKKDIKARVGRMRVDMVFRPVEY